MVSDGVASEKEEVRMGAGGSGGGLSSRSWEAPAVVLYVRRREDVRWGARACSGGGKGGRSPHAPAAGAANRQLLAASTDGIFRVRWLPPARTLHHPLAASTDVTDRQRHSDATV